MPHILQVLFRRATQRRFCIRVKLVVTCWLLLNMQMAIAAHHAPPPMSDIPSAHSQTMMGSMPYMSGMPVSQKAVCEKHCHPDNTLTESLPLQPHAIPVITSLLPVSQEQPLSLWLRETWQKPPVTGPPTEVRFCRFRE